MDPQGIGAAQTTYPADHEKKECLTLSDVEHALQEAERLRRKKELRAAITVLEGGLAPGLLTVQIYYQLGNVYHDLGDLCLAEDAYKRALVFDPDHVNALHNLSVACKKRGNVHEAVRMLRKSYRLEAESQGRMERLPIRPAGTTRRVRVSHLGFLTARRSRIFRWTVLAAFIAIYLARHALW